MKNKYFLIIIGSFFFFCFIVFFKGLKNPSIYIPELQKEKSFPEFKARDFYSDKKISSVDIFNKLAAYLTGAGLLSINKDLCKGCNI